ncbi:sugar ABC transporter permease [Rathayibacter tritici]|uniref:carbohydrate ABC transporter permease n=2 Tax=Rathayibacter tritici TaxID=33888 RepID=UPI000831A316|nr:sugar ABC transporter permease [Rathayibacter tritici]PPF70217.1 sugar ABC transporter permease [Rathayibacter tritici]PPG08500.1 sugar ABC transporter permease [Rathayibacter tritici]PPI43016.1 sugar ABC transporter permease [Rathayibacter tritici]
MTWVSSRWKITLMLLPALVFFTAFVVYPVLYSLGYSFTSFAGFGAATFNGLANYVALGSDPFFWQALSNTVIILIVSLAVLIPSSFALALLLQRHKRGGGLLRALVFGPAIIAPILVGLIWVFILDPKIGLLNRLLAPLGVPEIQWIGGDTLTPYAVSLVFIWSSIGFAMTIFYAGLQQLPESIMEAGDIDGASGWQRLRYITVPMMNETFGIVTLLLITNVFKIFELVYMLTGGGPVHRSETLVSYMYFVTFTNQNYGSGMAIAVIVFVLGALVSGVYLALARRRSIA